MADLEEERDALAVSYRLALKDLAEYQSQLITFERAFAVFAKLAADIEHEAENGILPDGQDLLMRAWAKRIRSALRGLTPR